MQEGAIRAVERVLRRTDRAARRVVVKTRVAPHPAYAFGVHVQRFAGRPGLRRVAAPVAAAGAANAKVLLHPTKSPAVVQSRNQVMTGVHDFHERLGIESGSQSSEARRWVEAATEARNEALETGAKGVGAAKNVGSETLDRAGAVKGRIAGEIAGRARRRRADEERDEKG